MTDVIIKGEELKPLEVVDGGYWITVLLYENGIFVNKRIFIKQ